MKKVRQILALILVVCMVCSMLPTVSAAAVQADPLDSTAIDFTNPADAAKFIVDNQTVSEIREGQGFYMISTKEAFEDCKGQLSGEAAKSPRDVVQVAVEGDWTATLYLKVDTSGSNGNYEFLCLYGMADYDNGVGVRAGNGSTVNFKQVDGINESSTTGMKLQTGLSSGTDHWYRLEKDGTTYTAYLSEDGKEYQKVFTYEDTGIEAKMIVIDAYSGSSVGYQYWLQSLTFDDGEPLLPCEHTYQAVATPPTCLEDGFTTYTCSKCGDSFVDDKVPALGHDYKNGVCTRCGEQDPNAEPVVPTLLGITLDGEPLEGFEPEKFDYELNADDYETPPVVDYLKSDTTSTTLLITGSDFQDPATSYTRSDYAQNGNYVPQQNRIKKIIGNIQEAFGTASYFIGGGDYNFDEIKDSVSRTNTGIEQVREAVQQACGQDVTTAFVQGNHDAPNSDYKETGPCDMTDFGLFTITEEDYRSYPKDSGKWSDPQNSEAKAQAVADQLETYLAQKAESGFDKPIFIASHVPLHFSTRTASKADAIYADGIYKAIYKYGDELNIIFLFGHNHAWGDDDYLGGASSFLTRGDTINIAKHGSQSQFTAEPLNFTYMNYGYPGYYWAKWVQSSSQITFNDAADSTLTMTAFQISGNQVTVSRWDEIGMHNLKSKGVKSLGLRPQAEVCEPNPKVVESPVTIPAPKNPTGGPALQITVEQFQGIPGTASITCLDPATGSTSVYRLHIDYPTAPKPDKTALADAIEEFEHIPPLNYTIESIRVHEAALAQAKAVYEKEDAAQEEIDAAAKALADAFKGLTQPDWSALEPAAAAAREVDRSLYTPESLEALDSALKTADALISQGSVLQSEIDAAAKALKDAMDALVRLPDKPENPFEDVKEGAFYFEPVLWAVNHDPQITAGVSADRFAPGNTCTRAQVVTFLWRAKGQPEPTKTDNPFTDVAPTAYYYKAVLWAVENGITAGVSKDRFAPNNGCTRGQVVTFLWRTEASRSPAAAPIPSTMFPPAPITTRPCSGP